MPPVMVPASSTNTRKIIVRALLVMAVLIFAAVVFLALCWPFRRSAVLKQLADASLSKVDAAAFHSTYFPRPGCVLEHVTFQHSPKPGAPPLITVEKMTIVGSFSGLFTKHVKRIRAEGMHIVTPPRGTGQRFQPPPRSTIVIDELIADGAILEVQRHAGDQPLKFSFHNFDLSNIGGHGPAVFRTTFSNPEPPGEITTSGNFGPWNAVDVGKTPVVGHYSFQHADLGVFPGIAGLLSSSGKFSGVLDHIELHGQTDTPRFTVTSSSHQVDLQTQFDALVNGENGDTFLQKAIATFWKTTVWSRGSVEARPRQPGKTVSLELTAKDGRIQDILLLFAQSKQAPMSGVTSFRADVSIPPGRRPFLEKVELQGDFGINAGTFTNSTTQEGVEHLSEGALFSQQNHPNSEKSEDDPQTVLSDLKGHVVLKDGSARFSDLSFSVPGASARMQGTYNLITEKIDLHGQLKTESQPSKTTSGVKALLLKVLSPFFKKKPVGYIMPVKITGTYDHPLFGLDLADDRNKKPDK
jgi:AsmA-like C-terminal region